MSRSMVSFGQARLKIDRLWLWELSGRGEQRCFELFVVCFIDTEDSRTGEN